MELAIKTKNSIIYTVKQHSKW